MTYRVVVSPGARRALSERLPPEVVAACMEFVAGPLAANPRRVGKPLLAPFEGDWVARRGEYRIRYRIDDGAGRIEILAIRHRRDAYRA